MVPLEPGDHPYIKHSSVMTFAYARVRTIQEIDKVIANKDAKQREPMAEKFLRRARSAITESGFTPYEVFEFYNSLDKYKSAG